jgi:hypothetical protein
MSKYTTYMPVDVKEVIGLFPKGTTVLSVSFNPEENKIIILWDNENLVTPFSVPLDFPIDNLLDGKLPDHVSLRGNKPKETAPSPAVPLASKPPTPPPSYMTPAELQVALSKNESVVFMGLESKWKPVEPGHIFTEGFFYKKAGVDDLANAV